MKRIAILVTALLSFSAAQATEPSPGKMQLAAELGLDAAAYTMNELLVIKEARREGESTTEDFYLAHGNRVQAGGLGSTVTPGKAQLAAELGLEPAEYTLTELIIIKDARREANGDVEAFYLSHLNREVRGGVGTASPGKAQLAAGLGLDPAAFTLSELVARIEAERGDD